MELTEEAVRLHQSCLVIDGHNDLAMRISERAEGSFDKMDIARNQPALHTDIPRLIRGGVGAQFWAAYVPPDLRESRSPAQCCLEQLDLIHRMIERYARHFAPACTADEIEQVRRVGKIACLIGIENGSAIESSLGALRMFYTLGARYMTLTHVASHEWADSATDEPRHGGLSPFGESVIREMNRLGMMADISHVSEETMRHVLKISEAPVIATHSSACAIARQPRNIPDDVLRGVAGSGGIVMVNFASNFIHPDAAPIMCKVFAELPRLRAECPDEHALAAAFAKMRRENPMPSGNVGTLVDHIDHIAGVAGIDHVGLGSDYDGIEQLPEGLEDVSCYPHITQELLNRDYTEADIRKVLGLNLLRTMRATEKCGRAR